MASHGERGRDLPGTDGRPAGEDPRRRRRARPRDSRPPEVPSPHPARRVRVHLRPERDRGPGAARGEARARDDPLRHQHAAARRPFPPQCARRGEPRDPGGDGLRLRRHGQHPHRDEPGRVRLRDQADRLRGPRDHDRQDPPALPHHARGAVVPEPAPSPAPGAQHRPIHAVVHPADVVSVHAAVRGPRPRDPGQGGGWRFLRHLSPGGRPARHRDRRRVGEGDPGRVVHDGLPDPAEGHRHRDGVPRGGPDRSQHPAARGEPGVHVRHRVLRGVRPPDGCAHLRERRP